MDECVLSWQRVGGVGTSECPRTMFDLHIPPGESPMKNQYKVTETLSARQFAEGLLAGLAIAGEKKIAAGQIHRAFRQVLAEVEASKGLDVDFSDVDYDPLYGQSGWLDQFLARAQRDLMISYPNPSYGRIEIKVTPSEGQEMLDQYPNGDGAKFKDLSQRFIEKLSA